MEAGAHVWCRDTTGDQAWILSEVIEKTPTELKVFALNDNSNIFSRPRVKCEDDNEEEGIITIRYEGVELANAKLSDEEREEGKDNDLITLPHLHEPALLHAVEERFMHDKIYTWTGPVLIAVNPFTRLQLYTQDILDQYRREGLLKSQNIQRSEGSLAPHIYSIADRSYRQMMREKGKSQSILISGESGAGKTESTKIVMLYLTTLGSNNVEVTEEKKEEASVMERVLQSNPILEAFGNAKTLRNDNSSRFGKYIELGFSKRGVLLGARVQTYLLEKVRLGFHASGERNYHIFYQVLRGASEEEKKKYGFHEGITGGLELANYFHFTGQGGAPQLREFTDEAGLKYTVKAMRAMNWSEEKINTVLSLVAGMLHLGQISFNGVDGEGGEIAEIADPDIVQLSADLLGVNLDKFKCALTEKKLVTRGDVITMQLPPEKAGDARDALAKTIYGALFLWVVAQVNECISWENDSEVRSSIGVLDIFGFESFAINSFEQLCINFTNEALQQQFNKFIFKMEQDEYEAEKIDWAFVSFPDNQDVLDMIQKKPTGILSMLDDECRVGSRGSDRNWAQRMYKQYIPKGTESDNKRFSATAVQKGRAIFCVTHFAGTVQYSAETGFLEKNKDEIPLTCEEMCVTAPNQLLRDCYEIQRKSTEEAASAKKKSSASKAKTVGQQFKEQLAVLIQNIEKTEPHYIRCLKPNDAAKPKLLTRKRLTEQLRYGGVLEAVRVARMGYPVRLPQASFYQRYRMLLPSVSGDDLPWALDGQDPQNLSVKLLDKLLEVGAAEKKAGGRGAPSDATTRAEKIRRMQVQPLPMTFPKSDVQLGLSKVFMRKPPHDSLEAHRVFHQNASSTHIQAVVRGAHEHRRYLMLSAATAMVQRVYRGYKGRARWWFLRELQAGILLTKTFRMLLVKRRYVTARDGTIKYQALARGYNLRKLLAVIKVQTHYRMFKRSTAYRRLKSATIALQCRTRCIKAKKVLAGLQGEQKDIGKLRENNEALKMEMASLKAMLSAQAASSANKEENQKELAEKEKRIAELEKRVAELEKQIEKERATVAKLEKDMEFAKIESDKEIMLLKQRQTTVTKVVEVPRSPKPQKQHIEVVKPATNSNSIENVNPAIIEQHLIAIEQLEIALEAEKRSHRDANAEIIKLRAAINGVNIDPEAMKAIQSTPKELLLPPMTPVSKKLSLVEEEDDGNVEDPDAAKKVKALRVETKQSNIAPEITGSEDQKEEILQKKKEEEIEDEEMKKIRKESVTPEVLSALNKLGVKGAEDNRIFEKEKKKERPTPQLLKSPSEYFPMVRRGFASQNEKDDHEDEVVAVGWKVEITNRREREEALRDEVRRFEVQTRKFYAKMEEGVDVTLWQLNRNTENSEKKEDFVLSSSPITMKLHKRGELLLQAVLTFNSRGGYLSKALGRGDRSLIDPLALHEILEVKSGSYSYDSYALPSAGKSNMKSKSNDGKHSSLFLTLKAAPTPVAASRLYFIKFKSRSARNDLLQGLRGLLADVQIHEGVSISTMHSPQKAQNPMVGRGPGRRMPNANSKEAHNQPNLPDESKQAGGPEVLVPLSEVHKALNRERQNYDRLLLLMLQGTPDLKEKEEEMLALHGRLATVMKESDDKDRVQANDSKLIMQLSKKLEMLLMENEDLRDQNDRLNSRLVAVECEKMNLMT